LKLYQYLLLQCITIEPGTVAAAIGLLSELMSDKIDKSSIEETFNQLIVFHGALNHYNEVAWIIWGIMVLKLRIYNEARKIIEQIEDSIVILMALHAEKRKRFKQQVDKSNWQRLMTEESLYGERWLLAYEALVREWLPSADKKNYISSDPYFKFIAKQQVRFYQEKAVNKVKPTSVPPSVGIAPIF